MSPPPSHVPWPQLPPIVHQLRFGRAMALTPLDMDQVKLEKGADGLISRITKSARHAAGEEQFAPEPLTAGVAPLDDYFERLSVMVADDVKRSCGLRLPTPEMNVVIGVAQHSQTPQCRACEPATSAGTVCSFAEGSFFADQKHLSSGGLCLEPMREWFVFCKREAEQSYSKALCAPVSRDIFLSTLQTSNANKALSIGFSADVQGHPSGEREVRVKFSFPQFTYLDYFALPYVLFHECFAHGLCGLARPSTKASAFHEGWMDAVAARVLARILNDTTPNRLPVESGDFEARMDELRSERINDKRQGASADTLNWRWGSRAFEALSELFNVALASSPAEDPEAVEAFSMMLNANERFSNESRAELVWAVSKKFVRKTPAMQTAAIAADTAAQKAVLTFVATRDASALAGALLS